MKNKAVISGCYGQDGSYLSEILIERGYEVYGICRKELSDNSSRIRNEMRNNQVEIIEAHVDLHNYENVSAFLKDTNPDLFFHLAAVHNSSEDEKNRNVYLEKRLFDNNVMAVSNILCACAEYSRNTRVVSAGSCLMFDASQTMVQNEETRYSSKTMYGIAKITENELIKLYRNKGLFACTAVLYNHESHRRSSCYLTQKIAFSLKRIKKGQMDCFTIGNLDSRIDWGHAKDYMEGMLLMAQANIPKDYIIATGELHSIREFIDECANVLGVDNWMKYVKTDDSIVLRNSAGQLRGSPDLIEKELQWKRKYSFKDMVKEVANEN